MRQFTRCKITESWTLRNHVTFAEVTCKIYEKQRHRGAGHRGRSWLKIILQQCSSINPFISQEEDKGCAPILQKSGHGNKDRALNIQGGIWSGRRMCKEGPETIQQKIWANFCIGVRDYNHATTTTTNLTEVIDNTPIYFILTFFLLND